MNPIRCPTCGATLTEHTTQLGFSKLRCSTHGTVWLRFPDGLIATREPPPGAGVTVAGAIAAIAKAARKLATVEVV